MSQIIIALDYPSIEQAKHLIDSFEQVTPKPIYKLGLELIVNEGWNKVAPALPEGAQVMLDLKLADIPNTVHSTLSKLTHKDRIRFVTVHASAGGGVVAAAAKAVGGDKVLAVTVLTSTGAMDALHIFGKRTEYAVGELMEIAYAAGAEGVVCSPQEAWLATEFKHVVTPGIRPSWTETNDHARSATPAEAVKAGATHLVIGRPITGAPDPIAAYRRILDLEMTQETTPKSL